MLTAPESGVGRASMLSAGFGSAVGATVLAAGLASFAARKPPFGSGGGGGGAAGSGGAGGGARLTTGARLACEGGMVEMRGYAGGERALIAGSARGWLGYAGKAKVAGTASDAGSEKDGLAAAGPSVMGVR